MEDGGYTLNNLITSLLLFINNPEVRDTDYQIASCLLEHCYEIKNMTIQELAEKSYVSVSTINRFLKMYGFSRYSIFKSVFYQHVLSRYNQMRGRLSEWMSGQVECMLHTVLSEAAYRRVTDMPLRYNYDKQKKSLFSRSLSVCRLLFNSFSKLKIDENYKEKRRLFY